MDRNSISVVVATYNSAGYLKGLTECLEGQLSSDTPLSIEMIAVDGGSSDETVRLATRLGWRCVENPKGDPVNAKYLGLLSASHPLVCILDHDELLVATNSLQRKLQVFNADTRVKAVIPSGYKLDSSTSSSNWYASEFGDPFSLFRYRFPNSSLRRGRSFQRRFRDHELHEEYVAAFAGTEIQPTLIELAASGVVIDKEYFLARVGVGNFSPTDIAHFYSYLTKTDKVAITIDDPVLHTTADSWSKVFTKTKWRVGNAVNPNARLAAAGWSGRMQFEEKRFSFFVNLFHSQIMFALYGLTIAPVVIEAIGLAISRRRFGYLMHIPLTAFVIYGVVSGKVRGLFRKNLAETRYDGTPMK